MFDSGSRYPIAIDMSGGNIYAAQFKKTHNGPVIKGLAYVEGPWEIEESSDDVNELEKGLKELLKDSRFSGKRVLLHLPSCNISSFPIHIQVEDSETLEEALFRESKEYISFPLEETIIDCPLLQSLGV